MSNAQVELEELLANHINELITLYGDAELNPTDIRERRRHLLQRFKDGNYIKVKLELLTHLDCQAEWIKLSARIQNGE